MNGPTLEHVLKTVRGRGLPVERVRRLVRQVVLALDVVHAQKVVHRDLKPSNILLANEAGTEIAKVTDFGLVKVVDVNLQRTTSLAGASLGYAPPEQYEQGNQRVIVRTDVFSLAAITFEMLSGRGRVPLQGGGEPAPHRDADPERPAPVAGARDRRRSPPSSPRGATSSKRSTRSSAQALAADPNDRQASVQDWWQAIEPLLRAVNEPRTPGTAPRTDHGHAPRIRTRPSPSRRPSTGPRRGRQSVARSRVPPPRRHRAGAPPPR